VIQAGEESTKRQKNENGYHVHLKESTAQKQRPKMIVFSQKKLNGMNIDSIDICATMAAAEDNTHK
jgi:hypothetical protein